MAVAQVASSRAGHLEISVTLIVLLLAVASVSFTALLSGWPRAAGAAAAVVALGLAAEWAGTRSGFPFGAYRYTGLLRRPRRPCRWWSRWPGRRWACPATRSAAP